MKFIVFWFFISTCSNLLFGVVNPYQLSDSLIGESTHTLSGGPLNEYGELSYKLDVNWGVVLPVSGNANPYQFEPLVNSVVQAIYEYGAGESIVFLEYGKVIGNTGWKFAGWFGNYFPSDTPWLYHENLGWVYLNQVSRGSVWIYHDRLGWTWTRPESFPNIYINERNHWLFLDRGTSTPLLYDYSYEEWFELNKKYSINASILPPGVGTVTGMGDYYRWETVQLQAIPADGYIFQNWTGDYHGSKPESANWTFTARRDVGLQALFASETEPQLDLGSNLSLQQLKDSVFALSNLTEAEKQKVLTEILIKGGSDNYPDLGK